MIRLVLICLIFVFVSQVNSQPYSSPEELKKLWEKHQSALIPGEKYTYRVSYLGITVGNVVIETLPMAMIDGKEMYQIKSHLKSSKYYEFIYSLDDTLSSYIAKDTFLPRKFVLTQVESNKELIHTLNFDHENLRCEFQSTGIKKGKRVNNFKKGKLPTLFHDTFSAVYFVRGLPLEVGDVYFFPIVEKNVARTSKVEVEKEEMLDINGEKIPTIKVVASEISSKYTNKDTYIHLWYSKDNSRKLVKFAASIKIGNVQGELISNEIK